MKKQFILIAAASLMAACAEDITTNQTDGDKRYISFSVSNEQNTSTRSVVAPWAEGQAEMADVEKKTVEVETDLPTEEPLYLTITDEPFIHDANSDVTRGALLNSGDAASLSFGVTEFLTSNPTTPIFSNSKPARQRTLDDGRELFKANEFWEYDSYDGTSYDFYAYAPWINGTGQGITLSNENRTITYDATGVAVNNQPDLMTAMKWSSSYVGAIPLNFQHRLCVIQIITAGTWATGYHVSGVQFTNVISSGTFDIDTDKDTAWDSYGSAGNYTVTGFNEASATGTTITGTVTSTSDERWLMLPPQTLAGAKLSITMSDNTTPTPNSYTISAPIHASTWTAGHTVTYTVSPEAISTLTVNYPTGAARSWINGTTPVEGPVTSYAATDQFGLFVLDKDNKIVVSNAPVNPTASGESPTLDIPSTIFKSKQYKYFLMHPYISDDALQTLVTTGVYNNYYKLNGTGRPASADAFFAEVISNWTPANDQSTEAKFKKQDLQIAVLSGSQFYMVHKMGMAQIILPYKALIETRTDNNGSITNSGTVYKTASSQFASATPTPYLFSDGGASIGKNKTLYYVVKNSATIASKSTVADAWSQPVSAGARELNSYTVNSTRTYYRYVGTYSNPGGTAAAAGGYSTTSERGTNTGTYTSKEPYTVSLEPGNYVMKCWGAAGEDWRARWTTSNYYYGGHGGYTAGNIFISSSRTFYVFTGNVFGYNGGTWTNSIYGASGGSSTDIRLTKGTSGSADNWANWESRKSRIMVAGGGGGGMARDNDGGTGLVYGDGNGGYGGGLIGGDGQSVNHTRPYGYSNFFGGGQDYNGYYIYHDLGHSPKDNGSLSYTGAFGGIYPQTSYWHQGGWGGGWYTGANGSHGGPSGGSSYISGHAGCIAVTADATEVYNETTGRSEISHRTDANAIDKSTHFSGLKFTNTVMIDGEGYQWTTARGSYVGTPKFSGSGTQAGNPDLVGYAKITTIPDD